MCDDVFDEDGPGDGVELKVKEFDRMNRGIEQTAFRDAYLESKDVSIQKGFEDGFKESYNNHSSVNLVKGFVTALLASGIISNSDQRLPSLIKLKEDIDSLEEKLSNIHDVESSDAVKDVTADNDVHKQQLIVCFDAMKDKLKELCASIDLNLSEDIINCKISFNHPTPSTTSTSGQS